jgi:hypothetical protein
MCYILVLNLLKQDAFSFYALLYVFYRLSCQVPGIYLRGPVKKHQADTRQKKTG